MNHEDDHHADDGMAIGRRDLLVVSSGWPIAASFASFGSIRTRSVYAAAIWPAIFPCGKRLGTIAKRAIDVHFLMIAVAVGAASIGAGGRAPLAVPLFLAPGAGTLRVGGPNERPPFSRRPENGHGS